MSAGNLAPPAETRRATSPLVYMPGQAKRPTTPREHPGRKSRTTAAGWVLDYLVPRNQTVLLCEGCNHGFARTAKRVNYFSLVQRFGLVYAACDGCKDKHVRCHMYTHESLLGTRSGQCWDTRFL